MSRDLPRRPHLDHLKKQAKALLRRMRDERPDATLADAQHALAREYGFASWSRLKSHIEALPSPTPLFDRFTEATKRALFFSRYEAGAVGRIRIAPEHVLLGVIRGSAGVSRTLFDAAGVRLDEARAALTVATASREAVGEAVEIPFLTTTKALFQAAADEADRLGHSEIATVHVLLAVLRESGTAGAFLGGKSLTLDAVRKAAATAADEELQ